MRPCDGVLAVRARPVTPTSAWRPVAPQRARPGPSDSGANPEVTAGPGGGRPAVARMLGTPREIVTGLRRCSAGCGESVSGTAGGRRFGALGRRSVLGVAGQVAEPT